MATMTATMTISEQVTNVLNSMQKGTFGTTLIAVTEPKMNKRGNLYFGRVQKATYLVNVALGYGYENTVNNRLAREGKTADFVSQAPFGRTWVKGMENLLLQSTKNEEQYYLRTTMLPNTTAKVVYLVDNRRATEQEVEEILRFIPQSRPSNQGLAECNEVIVRDFKLENNISIKQGAKSFQAYFDIPFEALKAFFAQ